MKLSKRHQKMKKLSKSEKKELKEYLKIHLKYLNRTIKRHTEYKIEIERSLRILK